MIQFADKRGFEYIRERLASPTIDATVSIFI